MYYKIPFPICFTHLSYEHIAEKIL